MKNVLKTLGIMCIIAAALFIAACGDGTTTDPTYTVTFDTGGGTVIPAQSGIEKNGFATKPTDPTRLAASAMTAAQLQQLKEVQDVRNATTKWKFWKLSVTDSQFQGWTLNGADYNIETTPVTDNITLVAKWDSDLLTEVTGLGTTGNTVEKVFDYISGASITDADSFLLALGENVTKNTKQVTMTKAKLTIVNSGGQRSITGFTPTDTANGANATSGTPSNHVAFLIGLAPTTGTTLPATKPTLTLYNIALKGNASIVLKDVQDPQYPSDTTKKIKLVDTDATAGAVADSLVRLRSGATLIMDDGSTVTSHANSATTGSSNFGNGSAVCVVDGSTLTMKEGSTIEGNASTGTTGGNRNLVGGVYTYMSDTKTTSTVGVTLNIEGGQIKNNNVAQAGQTKDLYATEGGTFNLSGKVVIDELTLNGDDPDNSTSLSTAPSAVRTVITVSNLLNPVGKLSLRSTTGGVSASEAVGIVKAVWADQVVLQGSGSNATPVAASAADVARFTLGDFKHQAGYTVINPNANDDPPVFAYEIVKTAGADIGKFKAVVTP